MVLNIEKSIVYLGYSKVIIVDRSIILLSETAFLRRDSKDKFSFLY